MEDTNWLGLGISIGMMIGYFGRMAYEWAQKGKPYRESAIEKKIVKLLWGCGPGTFIDIATGCGGYSPDHEKVSRALSRLCKADRIFRREDDSFQVTDSEKKALEGKSDG